jgi:hypothetical protein
MPAAIPPKTAPPASPKIDSRALAETRVRAPGNTRGTQAPFSTLNAFEITRKPKTAG